MALVTNGSYDRYVGPMKRTEPRLPASRRAKILFGTTGSMDCRICDVSSGGALLQLRGSAWMPRTFLLKDSAGPPRQVVVVWEGTNHIGVRFTDRSAWAKPQGFGQRSFDRSSARK